MNREQEKSELKISEVRRLEDSATQTRFTWAVIFVALVTVLVGLLNMIKPYTSEDNPFFNGTISIIYIVFAIGMSYTFYAICQTSFIIDKLNTEHETTAIKDFSEKYWHVSYAVLFRVKKKENEKDIVYFKGKTVFFSSILVIVVSVLPLLFKLDFGVVVSGVIVLIIGAFGIITTYIEEYLIDRREKTLKSLSSSTPQ